MIIKKMVDDEEIDVPELIRISIEKIEDTKIMNCAQGGVSNIMKINHSA